MKRIITFKPIGGKGDLETGKLLGRIVDIEHLSTSKSNQRTLRIIVEILEGKGKGYWLDRTYLLDGRGVYYFEEFLKSIDLNPKFGLIKTNDLLGKEVIVDVCKKHSESNQYAYWFEINNFKATKSGKGELNV